MSETLTGNTRCRIQKRLFREPLLVLQVEVRRKGCDPDSDSDSCAGYYDYTDWRDIKVEDLPLKGLSDANKTADFD